MSLPNVPAFPLPRTRGKDARLWLEGKGLVAVEPMIRSSDLELADGDEFLYYLTRRLGLQPAFSRPEALELGSWFHKAMELNVGDVVRDKQSAEDLLKVMPLYQQAIKEAHEKDRVLGEQFGVNSETLSYARDETDHRALMALTWARAMHAIRIEGKTVDEHLSAYQVLGSEITLDQVRTGIRKNPYRFRIMADRLLYLPKTKEIYVLDWKTTGTSAALRAVTASFEFQTKLYRHVVAWAIEDGTINKMFPSLPKDIKFGGMIHVIIQKPTIKFGENDRDHSVVDKVLKSGPRKGLTVYEKVYTGEPRWPNYMRRVFEWYTGTGDYEHEKGAREAQPPITISTTSFADVPLDDVEFWDGAHKLYDLSYREPHPELFRRSSSGIRKFGSLSPYAPFFVAPIREWPSIILDKRFVVSHREDQVDQ